MFVVVVQMTGAGDEGRQLRDVGHFTTGGHRFVDDDHAPIGLQHLANRRARRHRSFGVGRLHDARGDVEGFGAVAVATYVVGMLPLLLLTIWAVLSGHFRDVERPKFRMLELDAEIERGGELEGLPMGVRRGA